MFVFFRICLKRLFFFNIVVSPRDVVQSVRSIMHLAVLSLCYDDFSFSFVIFLFPLSHIVPVELNRICLPRAQFVSCQET